MEDYIGLIVAAIIGIISFFASQKKKQDVDKSKAGTLAEDDVINVEALDAELTMDGNTPSQKAQPSTIDILGKILTGDFSDLIPQAPTPPTPVVRSEYIDPIKARNKRNAELEALFDEDRIKEKARRRALSNTESTIELITSGNKAALGESIILGEILSKPVSMRNRRNVMH